jgi:hypothetical protein
MADVPIFSAINSLIKACEIAYKLAEVSDESAVFVRNILRVRDDLQETERLIFCPQIKAQLHDLPDKRRWINDVLRDTKEALNEVGKYVERARSDKERDGTVSLITRWQWVMSDHDKLNNRREQLSTCHRSLGMVLSFLIPLEAEQPATSSKKTLDDAPPPYNTVAEDDAYVHPHLLRKIRMRQKSQGEKSLSDGRL